MAEPLITTTESRTPDGRWLLRRTITIDDPEDCVRSESRRWELVAQPGGQVCGVFDGCGSDDDWYYSSYTGTYEVEFAPDGATLIVRTVHASEQRWGPAGGFPMVEARRSLSEFPTPPRVGEAGPPGAL